MHPKETPINVQRILFKNVHGRHTEEAKEDNHKFEASLGYKMRLCVETTKKE
jgi:hypothetical protein